MSRPDLVTTPARSHWRHRVTAVVVTLAIAIGVPLVAAGPASAAAATGSISGNVKAGSANLAGALVHAYNAASGSEGAATTDANGNYTITGLVPGPHRIVFSKFGATATDQSYLPQWWQNSATEAASTATSVVAGATASGRNATLTKASAITGLVTDTAGTPLSDLQIPVWKKNGDAWVRAFDSFTDEKGRYQVTGLTTGTYRLGFSDKGFADSSATSVTLAGSTYAPQFYPAAATFAAAGSIAIPTAGSTIETPKVTLVKKTPSVTRFSGTDRYATAVDISKKSFGAGVPVVYVATGASFPDALAAAPAAAAQKGPLLLTPSKSVPAAVMSEITRLKPKKIVVVGGTAAVSAAVYGKLSTLTPSIRRDAGSNRYETSRVIVRNAFTSGSAKAFVATGRNFPDALAASAAAGAAGAAVVLVDGAGTAVDAKTKTLLSTLKVTKATIAGGTGAVNAKVEGSLKSILGAANVNRLGGSDRYATAGAINRASFATSGTVYLANGAGFADALAGAALAGKNKAPLYTVRATCVPAQVLADIKTLRVSSVVLLGGTGALSANVAKLVACK